VRKTSDIAMLLGSRGKARSRGSRGGLGSALNGLIDGLLGKVFSGRLFGGRARRQRRGGATVPMFLFVACILGAFGGGFIAGDRLGGGEVGDLLSARIGQKPGFINEFDTTPLSDEAFVVTAYPVREGLDEAAARQRAADLARYLVDHGLEKARPYPWPKDQGVLWVTAVYFSGEVEERRTRELLLNMPDDVPDAMFCDLRINDSGWPTAMKIR
jgi:hypothetical protein